MQDKKVKKVKGGKGDGGKGSGSWLFGRKKKENPQTDPQTDARLRTLEKTVVDDNNRIGDTTVYTKTAMDLMASQESQEQTIAKMDDTIAKMYKDMIEVVDVVASMESRVEELESKMKEVKIEERIADLEAFVKYKIENIEANNEKWIGILESEMDKKMKKVPAAGVGGKKAKAKPVSKSKSAKSTKPNAKK